MWLGLSREISFHIYYWTLIVPPLIDTPRPHWILLEKPLAITVATWLCHCVNCCNLFLPPPTVPDFLRNGIFLCYGLRWAVQSTGKGNQQTSCVNSVNSWWLQQPSLTGDPVTLYAKFLTFTNWHPAREPCYCNPHLKLWATLRVVLQVLKITLQVLSVDRFEH